MRVAFRVDCTQHTGSGHLMRCLTLADALRARGAEACFLGRLTPAAQRLVQARGHALHAIDAKPSHPLESDAPAHASWLGASQADDTAASSKVLETFQPQWLVVDHYGIDYRWERAVRPLAGRLLVIDDLADRAHDCDVLLDQNFHGDDGAAHRYDGLVSDTCRRLLGPRYALMRPEFGQHAERARVRDGSIRRVLISFGGIDAQNHAERTLQAIESIDAGIAIDLVVGADCPHLPRLQAKCAGLQNVQIHVQTEHMADLMSRADAAIGAGGTSTWERLCMGLPTLAVAVASNQAPGLAALCEAGYLVGVNDFDALSASDLQALLRTLILSPALGRGLARRGQALVDGHGTQRVAALLAPATISMRRAGWDDCDALHAWRNDERVRAQSHDPKPIAYESHRRWLEQVLAAPERVLLIGSDALGPLGVVRFDLQPAQALVSVYLVPTRIGRGLSSALLEAAARWLRNAHPEIERLVAEVRPGNLPSQRAFERAGYVIDHHTFAAQIKGSQP